MSQNITKRCAKCGITLGAENISCPICGGKLEIAGSGQSAQFQPQPQFRQAGTGYEGQQPYVQPTSYGQPMQQYGQPVQTQYGQPMQTQYGQPMQQPYGQPIQTQYGQPDQIMPTGYIQSVSYQPPQPPVPPQPAPAKKSKTGLVVGIVAGVTVAAAAVVVGLLAMNGVFSGGKDIPAETGTAADTYYTEPTENVSDPGAAFTTAASADVKPAETSPGIAAVTVSSASKTENIYTAPAETEPAVLSFYTDENEYAVNIGEVSIFPKEIYFRANNDLVAVCVCSNGLEQEVTITDVNGFRLYDKYEKLFAQGDFNDMQFTLPARTNDEFTFIFDSATGAVINSSPDLSDVSLDYKCVYNEAKAYYYSETAQSDVVEGKLGFNVKEAYYDDNGDLYVKLYCSNGKDNAVFINSFKYLNITDKDEKVIAGAPFDGFCFTIPPKNVVEHEFTIKKSESTTFNKVSSFDGLEVDYSVNFTNMGTDVICMHIMEAGYNDNYDIVLKCCVYNNFGKDIKINYFSKFEVYDADNNLVANTSYKNYNKSIPKNTSIIYKFVVPSSDVSDYYADLSDVSVTYSYNYDH